MDIGDTILAKSDQVNAVDLAVPATVTVEGVDYYAVPNLPQILIGDSSCVGCAFENSIASCAGLLCGAIWAPKDEQVLLVRRPDNVDD